jgi:hypothetical protein
MSPEELRKQPIYLEPTHKGASARHALAGITRKDVLNMVTQAGGLPVATASTVLEFVPDENFGGLVAQIVSGNHDMTQRNSVLRLLQAQVITPKSRAAAAVLKRILTF